MRRRILLSFLSCSSGLLACDKPGTTPTTQTETPAPVATTPVATPVATPPVTPPPELPKEGTLAGLELGDRACYVHIDRGGASESIEGDFELCPGAKNDASKLVGKRVTFTTERASVLAASCQGDVDCGKSDVIDVVMTITAVDSVDTPVALDDLDGKKAELRLGPPASKKSEEWAADGGVYTTWTWPDKGVTLITSADGRQHSVECTGACPFATKEGVAIGNTVAEVKKIYADDINKAESSKSQLVVGDAYGGVFLTIKAGKVTRIFVGAAAE